MRCKSCGHHADAHMKSVTNPRADCHCGCVRLKLPDPAARQARLRDWIATAEFFVRNRWIKADVRVKAMGQGGALMKAVPEGKRQVLKPRTRVAQVRVTLTPVPKRKGGGA